MVEQYGPTQWNFLAGFLSGRTGKQCRERWCNHLCPDINKSSWSLEEEMLLLLMHKKIGNKWSEISKTLHGRTDNTIKNHWNSTMKKRLNFVEESLKNKKIEIKNRYKENNENNIEKLIIDEFKTIIETQMKKVIEDKQKNYENFKKIKIENFLTNNVDNNKEENDNNNPNITHSSTSKTKKKDINDINSNVFKLRKILGFRTHSKKRKKNNYNSTSKKRKKLKTKIENYIKEVNNNNDIIKIKDDNFKTPNTKQVMNKTSSSIKETEDNSGLNKKSSGDSNVSAFHCINREDSLSDKKYLLSHKYTSVKVITPFELDVKNNEKKEEKNNDNDIKNSKKNLSLLFNNID